MTPLLAQTSLDGQPCGPADQAGRFCRQIYELTSNEAVARASDLLVVRPVKITFIVLIAWASSRLLKRSIRRFTRGLGDVRADVASAVDRTAGTLLRTAPVTSTRANQRAETIGALIGSVGTFVVWSIAALMVFGEMGLELGPLLAGAGIVGIALGFGAQNLVRDFLSGIFMLLEDQFGVGDVISVGPATGTVEGVSLRTTRLRDVEGNVWHIPNGTIDHVANKSQQWSRALLDVQVSYGTETAKALSVIKQVATDLWAEEPWSEEILEEPDVWGVESLDADGVTIRLVVKTRPLSQWKVARELRVRIKRAFDAEGIEIPFPQRMVWHRGDAVGARERSG
ncbi:MAG TPA: mechanosensitive ion channel family protein [Acidimicrobiales bacterium]|nr:mechanosensitive ion channel family protein [Acidimicrobiales bacterium]